MPNVAKTVIMLCLILVMPLAVQAQTPPLFRFNWQTHVNDLKAYLGEPYQLDRVETSYWAPEHEWKLEMKAQYGGFYLEQYRYIEAIAGYPFETVYNFFQGKHYSRVYIANIENISLSAVEVLMFEFEAWLDEGLPGAQKKRRVLSMPLWGEIPADKPLPASWRSNNQLSPEDRLISWDAAMRWLTADSEAILTCTWNDIKQSAELILSIAERGHLHNFKAGEINDTMWQGRPPAEWRKIFVGKELAWGMDVEDVVALNDEGKFSIAIVPDYTYILQQVYAEWQDIPLDIYYSFDEGLSSFSCLIEVPNTGRSDFEGLERRLAAAISAELNAEELITRPRPAADDTTVRFPWLGRSDWGNNDTVAGMGGEYYADREFNEIIVNFHDRQRPGNASFVESFVAREAHMAGEPEAAAK